MAAKLVNLFRMAKKIFILALPAPESCKSVSVPCVIKEVTGARNVAPLFAPELYMNSTMAFF